MIRGGTCLLSKTSRQGHRKFDLFAERDEKKHGEQRRLVSRPYSMDALRDLEPYVDKAVEVFLENMSQREGQIIDMGNWVQLFAFGEDGDFLFVDISDLLTAC